ncbi:rod shape-determining protein [uncultured Cloacibacillus sp.]|uniref:rod shape-determining protein n=1 Tax=uncultured Cloacibacillus sp. TaxID=889794 RepID=UPI001F8F55FA|nr:rod shape-determining protein [uncultured Cloacibacillus sp.]HIR17652.1 rod shape-determining protein [Candidatus Caccocola faecigallinarum]
MWNKDIGIDLGTATVLVFVKGKGIVLREPSVVAMDQSTGKILSVGEDAKVMIGKTPGNVVAIRPLRDGVIADYTMTEVMLREFMKKVTKGLERLVRHRLMIGVPAGATDVERRAVLEAALEVGAKEAYLIEEPMAAAIGANMPVGEPVGNMVVDIGGGTTDIAIVSLGGLVVYESLRVGGDKFDESIVRYMRKQYNLAIGEQTAEDIKKQIGACDPKTASPEKTMDIRGRDLVQGLPRQVTVSSVDIARAIEEPVNAIVAGIKRVLEKTPPELSADVMDRGIILTGGGAYLRGIAELIMEETEINAMVAESAGECVALGTGIALESLDKLKETGAVYLATRKGIVNK